MAIDFDAYFKNRKNFSGNILVAKGDELLWNESYGYSDRENRVKNTVQTKFMIGSMTKFLTALCVAQLSEKKLLSVQQKVEEFFPDFYPTQGLTVHHLLTHTSGIPNFVMMKKQIPWQEAHSPEEILRIIQQHPLKFPAGKKWAYCNTNYLILGLIIEKVSGMKYHQYVKEHLFLPAQMTHSGFITEKPEDLAINYIGGKKGFFMDPSMFFACGDAVSTTGDFYLLDQALQNGILLEPQTLENMQQPHYNGKYIKYGYGLSIKNCFGCKSAGHSGSVPCGYTSHFERYSDSGLFLVVLSNDLVKYSPLSIKELGGTFISREIASLIYGKKLSFLDKML